MSSLAVTPKGMTQTSPLGRDLSRLPWGLTIACLLTLSLLIGLGVWQLQRLHWKQGLIAAQAEQAKRPEVTIEQALKEAHPFYRKVHLSPCVIRSENTLGLRAVQNGQAGFIWISRCNELLVDLGFAPEKPTAFAPFEAKIVGQIRPFESYPSMVPSNNLKTADWYRRDPLTMKPIVGAVRPDIYIAADTATITDLKLVAIKRQDTLSNRHLEYALTWFGLAITLMGFYVAMLYQRFKP